MDESLVNKSVFYLIGRLEGCVGNIKMNLDDRDRVKECAEQVEAIINLIADKLMDDDKHLQA